MNKQTDSSVKLASIIASVLLLLVVAACETADDVVADPDDDVTDLNGDDAAGDDVADEDAAPPDDDEDSPTSDELVPIRIATVPTDSSAQGFYGVDAGIFEEFGLDVEPVIVGGVPELAAAVAAGETEFGLTSPTSLASAHEQGAGFTIVAPGAEYSGENATTVLMVPEDSPLSEPEDFVGTTVAVNSLNTLPHLASMAWFDDAGVDPSEIDFLEVAFPDMNVALEQGQVDAANIVSPFSAAAERSFARAVVPTYDAVADGDTFLFTTWFAQEEYVEANPEIAQRFKEAIIETSRWANDEANVAERTSILQEYTGLSDEALEGVTLETYGTELTQDGLQPIVDLMHRFGVLDEAFDATDMVWQSP